MKPHSLFYLNWFDCPNQRTPLNYINLFYFVILFILHDMGHGTWVYICCISCIYNIYSRNHFSNLNLTRKMVASINHTAIEWFHWISPAIWLCYVRLPNNGVHWELQRHIITHSFSFFFFLLLLFFLQNKGAQWTVT